jgi:hypothetical protein
VTLPAAAAWWVVHLPHIVPAMMAFVAVGWGWYRSVTQPATGEDADAFRAGLRERRSAWRRSAARPSVARRSLLALGPLLATVATGAIIYGIDLAGDRAATGMAWIHAGIATLAGLMVAYKLADVGARRIRDGLGAGLVLEAGVSLLLLLLGPPLLVSGVVLLVLPSSSSFAADAHLIAAVWWTALLAAHLQRYLRAAWRSARTPTAGRPARAAHADRAPAGGNGLSGERIA